MWRGLRTMAMLAAIFALLTWLAGLRAERNYQLSVTSLRAEGGLRDISQLQPTRPDGTVYFEGPDEESPTAVLFSFTRNPSLSDAVEELVNSLPDLDTAEERTLRELVSSNERELSRLRDLAQMPPASLDQVIHVTRLDTSLLEMRYPEGVIDHARLMVLNAWLLHRDGHDDEALAECGRAILAAKHVRDIPHLLCQIIAMAIDKDTARALVADLTLLWSVSQNIVRHRLGPTAEPGRAGAGNRVGK